MKEQVVLCICGNFILFTSHVVYMTPDYYLHIMIMQLYTPLLSIVSNHHPLGVGPAETMAGSQKEKGASGWGTEDRPSCLWELSVTRCESGHC